MARQPITAQRLFNGKDRNFMTQDILRYGWKGDFAYELSTCPGLGRNATPLFGVTVIDGKTGQSDYARSQCLFSREEAEAYIASGFDRSLRKP